jgi:hypothetical protein
MQAAWPSLMALLLLAKLEQAEDSWQQQQQQQHQAVQPTAAPQPFLLPLSTGSSMLCLA